MRYARIFTIIATVAGIGAGVLLAYRVPHAPLLAYWLALAIILGLSLSLWTSLGSFQLRLRWLIWTFALLIVASLITTQLAARRAISSTHLVYRGVHLVGVDSFTVGTRTNSNVRLQTISSSPAPWSVGFRRTRMGWEIQNLSGVEQCRIRLVTRAELEQLRLGRTPIDRTYDVLASELLIRSGDTVTVLGPRGEIVDTLRLSKNAVDSANGSTLNLTPANPALSERYRRRLLKGTKLAALDGTRSGPWIVYERFVRIQQVDDRDRVNGSSVGLIKRLWSQPRYLLSAAPPYTLRGSTVPATNGSINEAALIEVRNGDTRWSFGVITGWRRRPAAERGGR